MSNDLDEILLWPDGTWCFREDLDQYAHMSDDYEVVPFDSDKWKELAGSE